MSSKYETQEVKVIVFDPKNNPCKPCPACQGTRQQCAVCKGKGYVKQG